MFGACTRVHHPSSTTSGEIMPSRAKLSASSSSERRARYSLALNGIHVYYASEPGPRRSKKTINKTRTIVVAY